MALNPQIIGNLTQATSKHPNNDETLPKTLQRHQLQPFEPLPVFNLTNQRNPRREGPLHALYYFDITNFFRMPQQRAVLQLAANKAPVERNHHLLITVPKKLIIEKVEERPLDTTF